MMQVSNRVFLIRYAWLSLAAALVTILLKAGAYWLTGSVGLLSDALESFVNLAGAFTAIAMLNWASQPPDEEHAYGHSKAEYFSSGVEGGLILIAAVSIAYAAVQRLLAPQPLQQLGIGLGISMLASAINLVIALVLLRTARRHESPTLEANAQHLFTDVWTSVGVLVGVGLVAISGWQLLDPIVAILVAANITRSGGRIVRKSVLGLMDTALPPAELKKLQETLKRYTQEDGIAYHALRTRQSGPRRFVSLHVLVPGDWSVHRGHQLLEQIEADIRATLPNVNMLTHLESREDSSSWEDVGLDRGD
ncbi:MAG: cation transporter [Chloroflexi bacterium]|nr:cation transporter [Chloroflexota bacterium]